MTRVFRRAQRPGFGLDPRMSDAPGDGTAPVNAMMEDPT